MDLSNVLHGFHRWFAEHDIPAEGVTVIINIRDKDTAVKLDHVVSKEMAQLQLRPVTKPINIKRFQMYGVNVQIESPLHDPHKP